MKKLGIFTRYDRLGASSRLRFFQWESDFAAAGFQPEFFPFFSDTYLKKLYSEHSRSKWRFVVAVIRRFFQLLKAPEYLLIEYELFPFFPAALELLLLARKKYILNFDDNVWEKYRNYPRLADKYDRLIAHAAGVIAANKFLYEKVRKLNSNTLLLPTVIQLEDYQKTVLSKPERFTLGWIGTPVTYRYLQEFAPVLQQAAQQTDFVLKVIASENLPPIPGVNISFVNWSAETEVEELCSCHAGIMPLTDDDFSKGKSAFKLIQYLGAGLPAIASPVGENCSVVTPGTGFLPQNVQEWSEAVAALAEDTALRQKMSSAARDRAYEYSQIKYAPLLEEFLTRLL